VAHLVEVVRANPELLKYISWPVIDTEADFVRELYKDISASPGDCLYAIFDKVTAPGEENTSRNYAGFISLTATNPVNAVTELGVVIFPAFHRTHVATNAIGLMLLWTLDPPSPGV
jgi:RimJ/RimL family protein N-acetyltransferase